MCWSSERTTELLRLIEVNGLDYEMTSVDLAHALWISRSLSYKWCSGFIPHKRVQLSYGIATIVTLGDFKKFVDSRIGDKGVVRKGRYSQYSDCKVVQRFCEDEAYVVVNPGDYFHHKWNGYPPAEGDIVTVDRIITNVTAPTIIGRELNDRYTALFAAADVRLLSKERRLNAGL